jgi:DMSO reductase anchor subunit
MVWLNFLVHSFGGADPIIAMVLVVAGFVSFYMKRRNWRHIDSTAHLSDTATATGLGDLGKVRLLEAPNTQQNFVQHEMVFRIGRKHSEKLRRYTFFGLFGIPLPLLMVTMETAPWLAIPGAFLGAVMVTVGVLIERWLFFAEATHTVSLYYGGDEA